MSENVQAEKLRTSLIYRACRGDFSVDEVEKSLDKIVLDELGKNSQNADKVPGLWKLVPDVDVCLVALEPDSERRTILAHEMVGDAVSRFFQDEIPDMHNAIRKFGTLRQEIEAFLQDIATTKPTELSLACLFASRVMAWRNEIQ